MAACENGFHGHKYEHKQLNSFINQNLMNTLQKN